MSKEGKARATPEQRVVPNRELRERIERRRKRGHETTLGKRRVQAESESEADQSSIVKDIGADGKCLHFNIFIGEKKEYATPSCLTARYLPVDFEPAFQGPLWARMHSSYRCREAPVDFEFRNHSLNSTPAWIINNENKLPFLFHSSRIENQDMHPQQDSRHRKSTRRAESRFEEGYDDDGRDETSDGSSGRPADFKKSYFSVRYVGLY